MKKFTLYLILVLFSFNLFASERPLTTADRLDIIDVINNYGLAVDNKDYDLFRSLFFDDVEARLVFDPSFFGGEEIIINGLDNWVAYITDSGALFKTSQHLIGNPLISHDGELVKVRSNLNSRGYYKGEEGRSVSLWGYYETYMQKDKDSWKITKHTFFSLGADE